MNPSRLFLRCFAWIACLFFGAGCGSSHEEREVVVYAAQDRVHAQPVFEAFARATGIRVRAIYDNEATKTVGLANRLAAEAGRPLADVWWSNEEMRTRQLIRQRVLEGEPRVFGQRRRVLVCHSNSLDRLPGKPGLAGLTNAEWKGRIAMAYPVFGSTATHLLLLRQRWGVAAWEAWGRNLAANRPLLVDGNSTVVKWVAGGHAVLGLTDSDDVAAARREGLPVVALEIEEDARLVLPNTVAKVVGAPRPAEAARLIEYLGGVETRRRLSEAGALDAEAGAESDSDSDSDSRPAVAWDRVLDELDEAVSWLQRTFVRNG